MISRRNVFGRIMLGGLGLVSTPLVAASKPSMRARLAELEARHGGKLGVAILDTFNNRLVANRGDERFPFCSVGKLPGAAFVLARVDQGQERLDRRVTYSKADLVTYSPETEKHITAGMTVGEICAASVNLSDNTAHNLVLDSFGGPAALTAYLRSVGDRVTRADRRETDLNNVPVGDERDTTTPIAMVRLMRTFLVGNALCASSRNQLKAWLIATRTGEKRLRAGTPPGWTAGDKTGTGPRNATNDAAVFYPPNRGPILVSAFYIDSPAPLDEREAVLAEVGRLAVDV